jgi:hypothetical protein
LYFHVFYSSDFVKTGPVTNFLVIPKPESSRVHTRNYVSYLEIPTLEKKFKQTNEAPIILQPSSFTKDADSAHACFHSSDLLSKQISDLQVKCVNKDYKVICREQ